MTATVYEMTPNGVGAALSLVAPPSAFTEEEAGAISALLDAAEGIREKHGTGAEALEVVRGHMDALGRSYYPADAFDAWDAFDVASLIRRCTEMSEHAHLHGYRVDVTWRRRHATRHGGIVVGKAGPTSKRDRELGRAPFTMTLALDVWVLLTPEERIRVVHHELGHCGVDVDDAGRVKFVGRGHDIEEFTVTLARYGTFSREQAQAVAKAAGHAETRRQWRDLGFDPATGQGLLFGATN